MSLGRSLRRRPHLGVIVGLVGWLALGTTGLVALAAHGAAPGRAAVAPAELASAASLSSSLRRDGRATLVVAAHPGCPCTRATLRELERVLATLPLDRRRAAGVDVVVFFAGTQRGRGHADRVAGDLRALAEAIPGVRVIDDPRGEEAARLGARTSGTVLFYDHAGGLRFNGGITPGRGHEGDSAGADALRALLARTTSAGSGGAQQPTATPVFGCALAERTTKP